MNTDQELRIVKITSNLKGRKFITEDVFNQEKIEVTLSGKQKMCFFNLPNGTFIYVVVYKSDMENARYIYTWRDAMSLEPRPESILDKQKKILDAQFEKLYGKKALLSLPS